MHHRYVVAAARSFCSSGNNSRFPKQPVLAVSAVVLSWDSALLVRRAKPPHVGVWSLPGGRVHLGETVSQAGVREVLEETGIQLPQAEPFDCTDAIFTANDGQTIQYHYAIVHLACRLPQQTPAVPGDDASECRWARLDQLDAYLEVTGSEANVDPFRQDCISMNVRRIIRKAARMLPEQQQQKPPQQK